MHNEKIYRIVVVFLGAVCYNEQRKVCHVSIHGFEVCVLCVLQHGKDYTVNGRKGRILVFRYCEDISEFCEHSVLSFRECMVGVHLLEFWKKVKRFV